MKTTKEVIAKLLKTSTGSHGLDSGGAYGRHWERNQTRDFESEPRVFLKFGTQQEDESIWHFDELYHNIYHWLSDRLDYDEEMDSKFQEFCDKRDESYFECLELFCKEVMGISDVDVIDCVNTYNHDSALSQVIQYWQFPNHTVVSIHNGCDVRGGYTRPVFFEYTDELYCDNKLSLYCEKDCTHMWYTDNAGYNWMTDLDGPKFQQLDALPVDQISPNPYVACQDKMDDLIPEIPPKSRTQYDNLYLDEDGNGYCPVCAKMGIKSKLVGE